MSYEDGGKTPAKKRVQSADAMEYYKNVIPLAEKYSKGHSNKLKVKNREAIFNDKGQPISDKSEEYADETGNIVSPTNSTDFYLKSQKSKFKNTCVGSSCYIASEAGAGDKGDIENASWARRVADDKTWEKVDNTAAQPGDRVVHWSNSKDVKDEEYRKMVSLKQKTLNGLDKEYGMEGYFPEHMVIYGGKDKDGKIKTYSDGSDAQSYKTQSYAPDSKKNYVTYRYMGNKDTEARAAGYGKENYAKMAKDSNPEIGTTSTADVKSKYTDDNSTYRKDGKVMTAGQIRNAGLSASADLPQLILGGDPSAIANAGKMAGMAGAASSGAGAAGAAMGATPIGAIVQASQMVGEAVGGALLSANTDDDGLYKNNNGTSAGLAIKGLTNPTAFIGNVAGGLAKIGEEPAHKVLGRMVGLGAKYDAQEEREKLNKGRAEKMLAEGSQKFLGSNRFGNDVTEMYRNGGALMPEYNAEDGEIVVGKPKVFRGGKVKSMGGNLYEVDGKSHEQGGVDMAGGKFILSDADKLKVNGMTPADMVREGADVSQVATMQETMKAKPKMAFGGINPIMGMDQYGLDFAGMGRMGQMKKASDMVMARMGMGTGTNSGIAPIAAKGIPAIMMKGISSIAGKTDASINVNPQIDTSGIKTQDIGAGSHNPSVSSRLAGMLGSAGNAGGGLLDNADIIANGFINSAARKRTVPEMGMQSRIDPVQVRADSQINDINTSVRDSQRSLEFAGGQNSSAAKLQALASGMDAKSRTMESVNNTNAQFKSQANMMNSDIEGRNLSSAFQNKMLKYQISDDLDARTSKNIATAVERRKVGKLDKAKEKLTRRQQLIQLAGSDPRAAEYLFSQLGDKGFADKLDSFGK